MATRDEKLAQLARLRQLQALQAQRSQQMAQAPAPLPQDTASQSVSHLGFGEGGPSNWQKFKHGLGQSAIETGLGVKSLFTDLSETEQDVLRRLDEDAKTMGGWATAGNVVGEVAQLAVPASKVAKLSKVEKLGRAAIPAAVAGEMALGGGFEALKAPQEDESRLENALKGAAGAALGMGAGKVLGKALEGIKKTDAAQYLTDLGVKLTPGQAAAGGLPRAIEYTLGILPFTSKATAQAKKMADETFNVSMLKQAAPPGKTVQRGGYEGMNELKTAYNDAYREAWKKAGRLDDDTLIKMLDDLDVGRELGSEASGPLRRIDESLEKYMDKPTTKQLDFFRRQTANRNR